MAVNFTMPQLGLTMLEGTVAKWFKQAGEAVSAGEVLVEISTDKITNQIESPVDGEVLSILVPEGGVAPVQAVLAVIGAKGEEIHRQTGTVLTEASSVGQAAAALVPAQPVHQAVRTDGWVKASPLARKLAREQGIDLTKVTGTGPEGRVVERDIRSFLAARTQPKTTPLAAKLAVEYSVDLTALQKEGRITKNDVLAAVPPAKPAAAAAVKAAPLSGMRKVIADRMTRSWQTAPHVHLTVEVDMTEARQLKEKLSSLQGIKCSYTEIIVKCTAQALKEYPMVNNSLTDGGLVENTDINIGIAVSLDNGLIVPVVRQADTKTLRQLNREIAELSGKAREGRLGLEEYSQGTFTISNLGMFGVDHFTPVINPPESAILGVCRVVEKPVVWQGTVAVRPMMNLCLAFDHRIVDGALGAKFMARVRQLVEQPMLLL